MENNGAPPPKKKIITKKKISKTGGGGGGLTRYQTQDLLNTSQMLLPIELLELLSRGAVGKPYIAIEPASTQ